MISRRMTELSLSSLSTEGTNLSAYLNYLVTDVCGWPMATIFL
jgi:hypothetical protein